MELHSGQFLRRNRETKVTKQNKNQELVVENRKNLLYVVVFPVFFLTSQFCYDTLKLINSGLLCNLPTEMTV